MGATTSGMSIDGGVIHPIAKPVPQLGIESVSAGAVSLETLRLLDDHSGGRHKGDDTANRRHLYGSLPETISRSAHTVRLGEHQAGRAGHQDVRGIVPVNLAHISIAPVRPERLPQNTQLGRVDLRHKGPAEPRHYALATRPELVESPGVHRPDGMETRPQVVGSDGCGKVSDLRVHGFSDQLAELEVGVVPRGHTVGT